MKLEETNMALSEERDTLAGKLQTVTDTHKTEKTHAEKEIKHLQKTLQEVQNHSQQQAEVIDQLANLISVSYIYMYIYHASRVYTIINS